MRSSSSIAAVVLGLLAVDAPAQTVDAVFPVEPPDGAVVGARPRFRIGVEGTGILEMRFRIELSRDGFRTVDYAFDQLQDASGWAYVREGFDEPGGVFLCRQPLAPGTYAWRPSAWNGVEWVVADEAFELTVDVTPPAPVEGLRVSLDRSRQKVLLDWQLVFTDADGGSERVALYHIYRYHRPSFSHIRVHEIGSTPMPPFEDTTALDEGAPSLLFYRVAAEDEAGNILRRSQPAPSLDVQALQEHFERLRAGQREASEER